MIRMLSLLISQLCKFSETQPSWTTRDNTDKCSHRPGNEVEVKVEATKRIKKEHLSDCCQWMK